MTGNSSENRPRLASYIVTIRDVIRAINTYDISSIDEVVQAVETQTKAAPEDARYTAEAALALGYITENAEFTEKGKAYDAVIREANEKRERERDNEDRVWPSHILYLVRGLPGAGKTSVGALLLEGLQSTERTGSAHYEIDQFITDKTTIDKATMRQASLECIAMTEQALIKGKDVVITNIFARYKDIIPYFELATYHSIRTQLIEVQGQWDSESRSAKLRSTIASRWSQITLPKRWKGWFTDRRRQLEMAKREEQRFDEARGDNADEIAALEESLPND